MNNISLCDTESDMTQFSIAALVLMGLGMSSIRSYIKHKLPYSIEEETINIIVCNSGKSLENSFLNSSLLP